MRYARTHDYGDSIRLVDVVDLPGTLPSWANGEPLTFLAKMYPNNAASDFRIVPDDAQVGWVEDGDGNFGPPPSAEEDV